MAARTADGDNLIANNTTDGVAVASGYSNAILANSMYANTGLGIDLAPGANNNQAAPVLTSVQSVALGLEIWGTLTSTPKKTFTIQFFANDVNEAEGEYFLGSQSVTTQCERHCGVHLLESAPAGRCELLHGDRDGCEEQYVGVFDGDFLTDAKVPDARHPARSPGRVPSN